MKGKQGSPNPSHRTEKTHLGFIICGQQHQVFSLHLLSHLPEGFQHGSLAEPTWAVLVKWICHAGRGKSDPSTRGFTWINSNTSQRSRTSTTTKASVSQHTIQPQYQERTWVRMTRFWLKNPNSRKCVELTESEFSNYHYAFLSNMTHANTHTHTLPICDVVMCRSKSSF